MAASESRSRDEEGAGPSTIPEEARRPERVHDTSITGSGSKDPVNLYLF